MNDIDLVFLKGSIEGKTNLDFLKKGGQDKMLVEICRKIAGSVTREEYTYWIARKEQFFKEGAASVQNTIKNDIAEGFYPQESED